MIRFRRFARFIALLQAFYQYKRFFFFFLKIVDIADGSYKVQICDVYKNWFKSFGILMRNFVYECM